MEVELSRVPQREAAMTPYEIILSESQERMLLVAARGREEEIKRVFSKCELDAVEIGHVTDDGILRVKMDGRVVAEVPVRALPTRRRSEKPTSPPEWLAGLEARSLTCRPTISRRRSWPDGLSRHRVQGWVTASTTSRSGSTHETMPGRTRGPAYQGNSGSCRNYDRNACLVHLNPPRRSHGGG
jgi:hypothetical protein